MQSLSNKWIIRGRKSVVAFWALCLVGLPQMAQAQQVSKLSLSEAWQMARAHYPLTRQHDLIARTRTLTLENASKGHLPAFSLNGQATYQSDVTNLPIKIPGTTIPAFSRDQYKMYAEADQVIYDGGLIRNQKKTASANEIIQQQNLEVELYALYDRVTQLYLGAILLSEQLKQNELLKADIQNGLDKTKAQVANGTAYRSSVDELEAQILQTDQARIEIQANHDAYLNMLSQFIGATLPQQAVLERPVAPPGSILDNNSISAVTRPELLFYDYQKKTCDLQDELLRTQLRPKFNFFVQGGYGRPGLNVLSNDFAWYYLGGLRLSWNFGSWYTLKNQKEISSINRSTLDIQKEAFVFNSNLTLKQQQAEIKKYMDLVATDQSIINKREAVKKAASAQLENGVLSAHDYINEVNLEDQARQNLVLHKLQLLLAQYNYQNTQGIQNPDKESKP